jgi:hypothetical protein
MRSPLLMLIPAVLMAQRSALPPQEAFDRELKKNRLGTWLVLEDEGAAWGAMVRAALDDDALVSLNLPLKVVSGGKKPDAQAAILRERYGWAKGAHWALVDAKGFVLIERSSQPTVSGLVSAAEQASVKSRTQELEDFLKLNPDHLEAQCALLRELVSVANRRTLKALGPDPEKPASASPEVAEPPRRLEAEADLRIWSPVAQRMDRLFKGGWREAGIDAYGAIATAAAEHSPTMTALLTRYRGDLEEALHRRPNAIEYWFIWLAASRRCGGWPLMPLLQSLQPLPGTAPGEWPPLGALNAAIKDMKERRDWAGIREILEPRWGELRSNDNRLGGGPFLWNGVLSPLVEALVTLGDVGAADQVLSEALGLDGSFNLPGQARDLATRLNRPDLAARWGALTPKGR